MARPPIPAGHVRRSILALAPLALLAVALLPAATASAASADTDHDGLPNYFEVQQSHTNPRLKDTNHNGISDAREDPDHDGLWNITEYRARTNPRVKDTDHNGVSDAHEDPDHDGLDNLAEQAHGTNPRLADTDGDHWSDGAEVLAHTNPRDPRSHPTAPGPAATPTPTPVSDPTPTPTPTPTPGAGGSGGGPTLPGAADCGILPATNVWNVRIDTRPVAANSATMIAAIGTTRGLHMDFGSYAGYGIPYNLVSTATPRSTVTFDYADESDQVPYPIPSNPLIEGGAASTGDRHILLVDTDACRLYELFDASLIGGTWHAGSGATWDLRSNALRPDGWTSADAAGLPILPGLVRYDEAAAGLIAHALRFTTSTTRNAHIYPARHDASSNSSTSLPPMGLRVRLKASFDTSGFSPRARAIAIALQRYGMILADNGSPWYVTGVSDPRFDDDELHQLDVITGADLEVVDTTGLVNGP